MGRSTKVARIQSITNGCQGGGNKKAGLCPTATGQILSHPFAWRGALGGIATNGSGRSVGNNKNFAISLVNQLGGVGRKRSSMKTGADGVNTCSIIRSVDKCNIKNAIIGGNTSKYGNKLNDFKNELPIDYDGYIVVLNEKATEVDIDAFISYTNIKNYIIDTVITDSFIGLHADMPLCKIYEILKSPIVKDINYNYSVEMRTNSNIDWPFLLPGNWGRDILDGCANDLYEYPNGGEKCNVYILDTGFNNYNKFFIDHYNNEDGTSRIVNINDDYMNFNDDQRGANHGTRVASCVGSPLVGTANKCSIVPIKVKLYAVGILKGFQTAIDHFKKEKKSKSDLRGIINLSMSSPCSYIGDIAKEATIYHKMVVISAAAHDSNRVSTTFFNSYFSSRNHLLRNFNHMTLVKFGSMFFGNNQARPPPYQINYNPCWSPNNVPKDFYIGRLNRMNRYIMSNTYNIRYHNRDLYDLIENIINYKLKQDFLTRNNYVLTVGAIDHTFQYASFSNFGSCIKCAAPGSNISTHGPPYWNPNPVYPLSNGCSFSSAFVAGIAAIILTKDPDLTPQKCINEIIKYATNNNYRINLTDEQVREKASDLIAINNDITSYNT